VVTKCITGTFEAVQFADETMKKSCGISAIETPVLRQFLVVLAIRHRNEDLLGQLLEAGPAPAPHQSVYRQVKPAQALDTYQAVLDDPNYGSRVWSKLVEHGWADPLPPLPATATEEDDQPVVNGHDAGQDPIVDIVALSKTNPTAALDQLNSLIASGWSPYPHTEATMMFLVTSGTWWMVTRFLPLLSRTLYDGIPPHPKWPGEASLVTSAAARADDEALSVVGILVELGGMDINISEPYKPRADWHYRDLEYLGTKLLDGSCTDETPLHAAVQAGRLDVVEYLLKMGAIAKKDAWGRDQKERAQFLGKRDIVDMFNKFGWK
jgi:hypothetical protein